MFAGCIQHAWKTYQASPHRAHRLAAVVRLQAGIRAHAARMHASHLRCQQAAVAAMEAAMCGGSRSLLQSAAAQLVQAGALCLLISSTSCSLVAGHSHSQLLCTFSFYTAFIQPVQTQAGLRCADAQCKASGTWVAVAGMLSNLASTQKHISLCFTMLAHPQAVHNAGSCQVAIGCAEQVSGLG